MSARRVLDAEVIEDPEFESVSLLARLLWDRLWQTCDWYGHGRWRADFLKAKCFPVDNKLTQAALEKAMEELEALVERLGFYEVKGQRFYELLDFEETHKGIKRGGASCPFPPGKTGPWTAKIGQNAQEDSAKTQKNAYELGRSSECGSTPLLEENSRTQVQVQVQVQVQDKDKDKGQDDGRGVQGGDLAGEKLPAEEPKLPAEVTDPDEKALAEAMKKPPGFVDDWLVRYVNAHFKNLNLKGTEFYGLYGLKKTFNAHELVLGLQKAEGYEGTIKSFPEYLATCCQEVRDKGL